MSKRIMLFVFVAALISTAALSQEVPQAIGFYTKGSLQNPAELPWEGPGFLKIFRSRQRQFGTDSLVQTLMNLAATLIQRYPDSERLQVADISDRDGGAISGHGSHQMGLDVDLIFLRHDRREMPVEAPNMDENFVVNGRVTQNFDLDRNWFIAKALVESGTVQRLFVDEAIKLEMCRKFNKPADELSQETLRRLRVWPNHANHYHVRFFCPQGSPACVAQAEPPEGTGCGAALAFDAQ